MKYLLDSNAVIALLSKSSDLLAERLRSHNVESVVTSMIVVHELFFGAFKSGQVERNLAALDEMEFIALPFESEDAREAGEIRAYFRKKGIAIGPYDVLIAGQARARGLIVVTHNVGDFSRVPGLRIEDWQVE